MASSHLLDHPCRGQHHVAEYFRAYRFDLPQRQRVLVSATDAKIMSCSADSHRTMFSKAGGGDDKQPLRISSGRYVRDETENTFIAIRGNAYKPRSNGRCPPSAYRCHCCTPL